MVNNKKKKMLLVGKISLWCDICKYMYVYIYIERDRQTDTDRWTDI